MYQQNALIYYRHISGGQEPEVTTFLGGVPEESPTSFAFEFCRGDDTTIIIVQATDGSLLIRKAEPDEVESLPTLFKDIDESIQEEDTEATTSI